MLEIHFLNAGRGDCIVIKYIKNGQNIFGIIDSNSKKLGINNNNTLKKTLDKLSVDKLSFVALTHPHDDHYTGLYEVISTYQLDDFFTYPILKHLTSKDRKVKLQNFYKEKYKNSSDQSKASTAELLQIFDFAFKNFLEDEKWTCQEGLMNRIFPKGFEEVEISIIAPHPGAKANYLKIIQDDEVKLDRIKPPNVTMANILIVDKTTLMNLLEKHFPKVELNNKNDADFVAKLQREAVKRK